MGEGRGHGGLVDVLTTILLISCLNLVLMAALCWYVYQIPTIEEELETFSKELGGVFQIVLNKLEKFEELVPEIEPPNPLFSIISEMMKNQTPKDRGATGQFVKAEIIEPSND